MIISLYDIVFISVPEVIIMYLLTNSFLQNKIKFNKIIRMSFIYGISCYFIKNIFPEGLGVLTIFLLYSSLFFIFSKVNLVNCFIALILSYGIKFVSEFVIVMYFTSKGLTIGSILDNPILKILFFYSTLVIPFMISRINFKNIVSRLNESMKRKISLNNKFIVYLLITLGLVNTLIMIGLVVITKLNVYKIYNQYEMLLIAMVISSVLCVTCLMIIVLTLEKNKDLDKIEKNLMKRNLKQMEETVDLLRTQKHDYMNHLQVILMQVSNDKSEDARRYILGLAEDTRNIGIKFDTGNNYIDAILNFKNSKCLDRNIELTACIDSILENTSLDDTQLSSIFLNIIDNAIDELKKYKKEYKYIHVDTYTENNKHIISIKNNGPKINDTDKIFDMRVSTKGEGRGYGLYSIKQLLLSNECNISVISDEQETEFIIEIPIINENYELLLDSNV